jgi:hypothetical protein
MTFVKLTVGFIWIRYVEHLLSRPGMSKLVHEEGR